MTRKLRFGAALVLIVVVATWTVSLVGGSGAQASDPPHATALPAPAGAAPASATSPFSLTVSPTRLVVTPAADGVTQRVQVINGGRTPLTVTVLKQNFSARPDGTLDFGARAPYSASNWVVVAPTSFALAGGARQTVTVAISVPPRPEPGDHQVALVFLVPAGRTSGNIRINRGIAVPTYIAVPGPSSNAASLRGLHAPGFAIGGPVRITAQIHDSGTEHRDFRGATPLRIDTAGSTTAFPDFTVLRGATRDVATTWSPPLLCICHPRVTFVNADGAVQSKTIQVIVLPLPLMALVLGSLLVLVAGAWLVRRTYRANVLRTATILSRPVSSGDV